MFTKKVSKEVFEKLPKEAQEKFSERALSYSDEIFKMEKGIVDINLKSILGTTDEGIINGIKGQFTDFFDKSYGTLMTDDWITSVKKLAVGDKPFKFPLQKRVVWANIPFTEIKYRPKIIRTIFKSAEASAGAVGTDAYNIFVRSRLGRYTTAIVIGSWLAQADAQNEKFKGKGINNFIVNQPYRFDTNPVYNPPNIADYYVQLAKEKGESSRFFLASPCKTDLTLSKTISSCEITNGVYILKESKQPVNPGSIKFDESAVESKFTFDEMSKTGKVALMEKCLNKNLVFDSCFGSFLKKHEDSFDVLIDDILELVDGPIIRYMERNNVEHIYSDLSQVAYPKDPDYKIFIRFHTAANYYYMLMTLTNEYRQKKIDKETFKKELKEGILHDFFIDADWGSNQEKIRHMMRTFYLTSNEFPTYFSKVFNTDNGVFFIALRDYVLYYHLLDDSNIDKSNVIKVCNNLEEARKTTNGILEKDASVVKGRVTLETISILPNMEKYSGNWNNGVNYCFSGPHPGVTVGKWLANGIAIAIDIGVGMTGVGLLVEAPVAVITGGGAAWASRQLSKWEKWPNH